MRNYGNPGTVHADIYAKLHANRFEHVEQARRARDYQAQLADADAITLANCRSYQIATVNDRKANRLRMELLAKEAENARRWDIAWLMLGMAIGAMIVTVSAGLHS